MTETRSSLRHFPWWAIPFICLGNITYELNSSKFLLTYDGPQLAAGVLAIMVIVLIHRVLCRVQEILLAKKQMRQPVRSRYASLWWFVIFVPGCVYRAASSTFVPNIRRELVPQWDFQWGRSLHSPWFVGLFLVFLMVHTVWLIVEEIQRTMLANCERVAESKIDES